MFKDLNNSWNEVWVHAPPLLVFSGILIGIAAT